MTTSRASSASAGDIARTASAATPTPPMPFPIAGLELLDSLRAKKRSRALDDLLLGRGRALAHFSVRGGGGERRRRRGTAR